MDVRCGGCDREVSEWAARCPSCGRALDDAEMVVVPEPSEAAPAVSTPSRTGAAGPPVQAAPVGVVRTGGAPADGAVAEMAPSDLPMGRAGPWMPRRRVGVLAVAVVAVAALMLGVFAPGQDGTSSRKSRRAPNPSEVPASELPSTSHAPAKSSLGRLPAGLASERLFFAEPTRTGLYRADGSMVSDLRASAGAGYPLEPLVSGRGVVVYIHGNFAYKTDPNNASKEVRLAPASWIFPADHGAIGIESGGQDGPASVTYMAAGGAFPEPRTSSVVLPPGTTAVAQVPRGLIVAAGATLEDLLNQVTHLQLSVIEAHSTAKLGAATSVTGVSGATAALVTCPSRGVSSCALQLVNTTTHQVRSLRPPSRYGGFAQGGGFSPDGKLLATFVPSPGADGTNVLHLAVLDVRTGTATVVGPSLRSGSDLVGDATWSTDGHWLFFGSLSGALNAEQVNRDGPHGKPWPLPLATSLAIIGD